MNKTDRTLIPRLLLASRSPRRKDLLSMTGLPFRVVASVADETIERTPEATVLKNALVKARGAVYKPSDFVLGCDTIVYLDRRILGKPRDEQEAERFLGLLSGRTHTVFSGVALLNRGKAYTGCERTDVVFDRLTRREIRQYVRLCRPLDKAGAYGIQEWSSFFVRRLKGDYFNVVGLPLNLLFRLLKRAGYPLDRM
jgi:septum formation protein